MRLKRLSFFGGWVAVALLAIAGFATFRAAGPDPAQVRTAAAEASIGHLTGTYAGLTFALRPGSTSQESVSLPDLERPRPPQSAQDEVAGVAIGTIASSVSGWLSELEVRALVSLYFKPEDVNRAIRVAWCESRFDPNLVNLRTGAVGLFQHLPQYWEERSADAGFPGADPSDPEASTAAAALVVYSGGGWDVFTCRGQ